MNMMWSGAHRKESKTKKLKSDDKHKSSKHSKSKSHKKHHYYKLAHADTTSDYIGPERLTKQVGLFNKGKISNSISRMEKLYPKEIKARTRQDLHEVLNLTNGIKIKKKHRKNAKSINPKNECDFIPPSVKTPSYLLQKTGFASTSWKNKLQKSVGAPCATDSVLASIRQSPKSSTPFRAEVIVAREEIVKKLYPFIKKTNNLIFPTISNKDMLKNKLLQLRPQLSSSQSSKIISTSSDSKIISTSSDVYEHLPNSFDSKTADLPENKDVNEEFHLNPIFTGESITNYDISNMFPSVNTFVESDDNLLNDIDSTCSSDSYDEIVSQTHSSHSKSNSVKLLPISPTSSEDSPVWKVEVSPVKFVPNPTPTPKIYFRHKMF